MDPKSAKPDKKSEGNNLVEFRTRSITKLNNVVNQGSESIAEALMLSVGRPIKNRCYKIDAYDRAVTAFVEAIQRGKEITGDPTGYILATLPSYEIDTGKTQLKTFTKPDPDKPKQRTHDEFMAEMLRPDEQTTKGY